MLFKLLGLLMVASTPLAAATPETLQLAHRLIEDQAGSSDYVASYSQSILDGFDATAGRLHIPDAERRRAAMKEALAESQADIHHSEDELAAVYANNLTREEMSGWIAFLETPEGRPIEAKKRQAGWPLGRPELTPDEIRARDAFDNTLLAKSIESKNDKLQGEAVQISLPLATKIGQLANNIYCKTATCPATGQAQ